MAIVFMITSLLLTIVGSKMRKRSLAEQIPVTPEQSQQQPQQTAPSGAPTAPSAPSAPTVPQNK